MDTLVKAFENQLDRLFASDAQKNNIPKKE